MRFTLLNRVTPQTSRELSHMNLYCLGEKKQLNIVTVSENNYVNLFLMDLRKFENISLIIQNRVWFS